MKLVITIARINLFIKLTLLSRLSGQLTNTRDPPGQNHCLSLIGCQNSWDEQELWIYPPSLKQPSTQASYASSHSVEPPVRVSHSASCSRQLLIHAICPRAVLPPIRLNASANAIRPTRNKNRDFISYYLLLFP